MKQKLAILLLLIGLPMIGSDEPLINFSDGTLEELESLESFISIADETKDADSRYFSADMQVHEREEIPQDLPVDESLIISTAYLQENTKQIIPPTQLPLLSFQGLDDSLTRIPPDTMGAVGLNHVMTMLNDRVRIQTKTGITLSTTSLSAFFGTSASTFDPKIVYDPFNNRWIAVALASARSAQSSILLAVSRTSDPTSSWNRYSIRADSTGVVWADFPSIGFNNKWIVIQTNMYSVSSGAFVRSNIYAVNKTNVYNGGSVSFRTFTLANAGSTQAPAVIYDNVHPTMYLLQNWNGNSNGQGFLRLYTINGTVSSPVLAVVGLIGIGSPWGNSHAIFNKGFAAQLGTTTRIMNNDARIQNVVFRNNSLWATQSIFLPASSPTRCAVQWFQLSTSGAIQQFGRIDDPTANLNTGTFFAFPSIAVNNANDALIGYSIFNPLMYAGSGYSFRHHTDPINTFRSPAILRNGLDIYTKDLSTGRVRWGDYSATVVDPNGNDFWTIQESADFRTLDGTTRWTTWWGLILPSLVIL